MLDRRGDGAVNDDYRLHAGLTKIHRVQTLVPREAIAAELLEHGAVKNDGRDDLEAPVRVVTRGNFGGASVAGQIAHFSVVDALDGWQVGLLDFAKLSDLPPFALRFIEEHVNASAKVLLISQARGEQPAPAEAPPAVESVDPAPVPPSSSSTPAADVVTEVVNAAATPASAPVGGPVEPGSTPAEVKP